LDKIYGELSKSTIIELEDVIKLIEKKIEKAEISKLESDHEMLEYQKIKIEGLISELKTVLI
jgi:hypothetical protein